MPPWPRRRSGDDGGSVRFLGAKQRRVEDTHQSHRRAGGDPVELADTGGVETAGSELFDPTIAQVFDDPLAFDAVDGLPVVPILELQFRTPIEGGDVERVLQPVFGDDQTSTPPTRAMDIPLRLGDLVEMTYQHWSDCIGRSPPGSEESVVLRE